MEENTFVDRVADRIRDLGLAAPTVLLLEAHKPLAFVGSQLLLIAQPTLDLFFPRHITQDSIDLLTNSSQLEQLIVNLETNSASPQPHKSASSIIQTEENRL